MNMKYRIALLIMTIAVLLNLQAQELTIKGMTIEPTDSSAIQYERLDLADQASGLVKVKLDAVGATFEGNVIGETDYKSGEYWVYMSDGSYMLSIKHPNYVPLDINFRDLGIKWVEGKTTYKLTLQMPQAVTKNEDDGMKYLSLIVEPKDAKVVIDKTTYTPKDGQVIISLPLGEHSYEVSAPEYVSIASKVTLGAEETEPILVNLKLKKATLNINCPTTGAEVWINNEKQGVVPMQKILQAGQYTVELRSSDHKSWKQDITLELGEVRQLNVPRLSIIGNEKETFTVKGVSFDMVRVDGGTFKMGSNYYEKEHEVTLTDFYIGETEVTQELWQTVMGSNPSNFKGSKLPVESVSWDECQIFIEKLSLLIGRQFRLPSEAEWEFAAIGGTKSCGYIFSGGKEINKVAWYKGTSGGNTHPVKTKQPNELGLYDMSGNVWEWCQDWFDSYGSDPQITPTGPSSGSNRVCRGGSWSTYANHCHLTNRNFDDPKKRYINYGLRLAL